MVDVGDVLAWERTFTNEDVVAFCRVSGDTGRHHRHADDRGRLVVQGLLTATLSTKLGGDIHYIAREMLFEFLRPVFTGDTIRCELRMVDAQREARRRCVQLAGACTNQHGQEVLRFRADGVILDEAP
jgi:acyl dehydratase